MASAPATVLFEYCSPYTAAPNPNPGKSARKQIAKCFPLGEDAHEAHDKADPFGGDLCGRHLVVLLWKHKNSREAEMAAKTRRGSRRR